MSNPDAIKNELMCPLLLDYLEYPIVLSCCGRAISRDPLIEYMDHYGHNCPLCRADLGGFDPRTAPKSINLAYLVDEAKNENIPIELFQPKLELESKWKATINPLSKIDYAYQTIIGRLEIFNTKKDYFFKTLFVPIIDISGSMAGQSFSQVKYSLNRILDLSYKHLHLLTTFITYNDRASSIEINKSLPQSNYRDIIDKISATGGTSFKSSFEELLKVCEKHKSNPEISSIVVIFLTDGEDSSVQKAGRNELVKSLKTNIEKIWNKDYVVHTIGFGGNHDFDFLNNLRQIMKDGAYRFADPQEDSDALSNKINSLLDVIATSSTIPLNIISIPTSIGMISGENGKYWVNLTGCNMMTPYEFTISVNDKVPINVPVEFVESENEKEIWDQWYSYLIDEIASELLILSVQTNDSLEKQLHCELLQQRSRSIAVRLDSTGNATERLEKLVETIKTIQTGGVVNQLKLNDMKFEGKYATKSTNPTLILPQTINQSLPPISYNAPKCGYRSGSWDIIDRPYINRCLGITNSPNAENNIFNVIAQYTSYDACNYINNNKFYSADTDVNGSNALIVASSVGRCKLVDAMLNTGKVSVNDENNDGYNALDLAIIYGYWHTYGALVRNGATPNQNGQALLRTCISKRFYNLAGLLLKDKFAKIIEDMIDLAPTNEGRQWLSNRSSKKIDIETAITKGMYDVVQESLDLITKISWKSYLDIFAKPTPDHIRIVDLLLKNNKADANEIIEIDVENNNKEIEKEITWGLFVACEKGQISMFKTLLKYVSKESLNMQNRKGTTILWIASCNRHVDIVSELLYLGVDPNIANLKGDSPLIPCCQKGSDVIVELLLESGAKLNVYNKNRDNPVLICCRTGQAKILEMLLKRLNPVELQSILKESAEIDGFCPLLASTELDKGECIKVCKKYGADLEARTSPDNNIIQGATSVHLACFYGRVAALRTLCELGADFMTQTTVQGYTPLHIGIKQGHVNIVRYLLSTPTGRMNLEVMDKEGRTPAYYARINGNESILEEFFTNKLAVFLDKLLISEPEIEMKCANVLVKYGRSLACYEYDEITNINLGEGTTMLTHALLNGNQHLLTSLGHMGANMDKKDDYGIPASFWATYLGYNIDGFNPNEETSLMINRVKSAGQNSLQNKLLLNLQAGKPQLSYEQGPNGMNSVIKMSDGYAMRVNNGVLTDLKSSQALDHSLLGFVDKLKNNKVFPDGRNYLDSIIWNSKIHLIKLIASGEDSLQPVHLMALYLYSSNLTIFKQVNIKITNWKTDNLWNPFVYCLYQAISLLPNYIGEIYRTVDIKFNMEDYKLGDKLKWSTFSICSKEFTTSIEIINQKKGIVFIVKSQSGKNISKYSKNPADSEIIFLPGTEFVITNFYKANIIAICQANIRQSTYKATEKDLERASAGQDCIIIELEECTNGTNKINSNLIESTS